MKKILAAVFLSVFCVSAVVYAQDGYVYSNAAKDDMFNKFETKVGSYENALMVIVQTYDTKSNQQTVENIKISITDKNRKQKTVTISAKTPYIHIIEDYKAFKEKYDFSTSNAQRDMIDSHPDTSYTVKVEAKLKDGRKIDVFVADRKKIIAQQSAVTFPFSFSADCNTRYYNVINEVDESIDNSGLNDIKDYYSGPRIIKQ